MKKIDKIGLVVILMTIVLLNIFIGSNIKEPIWIIQTIVSMFTLIYMIIKKVKKEKNIIIKSKIDIVVLVFMIATFIPLLLKTYVTLVGCINFILKYWAVYGFYILVRNIINTEEKVNLIIKTVIISSIIPIVFGYDKLLGFNIFEKFLDFINAVKIEDSRMISTFGYANTFAAYLALTTSLSIVNFLNADKKYVKILYGIYIIVSSITILLTQSKFVLALIGIIILLFIIKGIKDKKITRKWIISGIVAISIFFIYFFIAINIPKQLYIGEEKNCVIRGIEKNSQYKMEFDIKGVTDKEYNVFEINIVEVTRYFSEKTIGRLSFSEFNGTKVINVETSKYADHIEIRFFNKLEEELVIQDFRINDEKYILEYKIIPDEIVRIFTTFNFKNSSVWQRVDYWGDSIDIIKSNWLIGTGGNTWRMLYGTVQDYLYYAKESHCYILEVWMSFGIIGVISYLFIIAIIIKNGNNLLQKNKNNKKEYRKILMLLVGISIIIIHSFMDFDMSYLIIEMIFYMFLAIINKNEEKLKCELNILEYVLTLVFVVVFIGNALGFISNILEDETGILSKKIAPWISRYRYNEIIYWENNNLSAEEKINNIKEFIKDEPYQYQNIMYEIMGDSIVETLNSDNVYEKIEDLKYLEKALKDIEQERKYDVSQIQKRADIILNISEKLLNKAKELQNEELKKETHNLLEIIVNEYTEKNEIILDFVRNGEGEAIANMKHDSYERIYIKAIDLLEKQGAL